MDIAVYNSYACKSDRQAASLHRLEGRFRRGRFQRHHCAPLPRPKKPARHGCTNAPARRQASSFSSSDPAKQSKEKSVKALLSLPGTRQNVRQPMGMRKMLSCASPASVFQSFWHTQIILKELMQWSSANRIKQDLLFFDVFCGLYWDFYTLLRAACWHETFSTENHAGTATQSAEAKGLSCGYWAVASLITCGNWAHFWQSRFLRHHTVSNHANPEEILKTLDVVYIRQLRQFTISATVSFLPTVSMSNSMGA